MKLCIIVATLFLCSCSMKQWYPTMGAVAGGGVGSIAGPAGGAVGAGAGALMGEVARGNEEIEEQADRIEALSKGDVETLIALEMGEQKSLFDRFTQSVKKILIGIVAFLLIYLVVPIFVAKKCSKTEAERNATRAPFHPSRPSYPQRKPRNDEES